MNSQKTYDKQTYMKIVEQKKKRKPKVYICQFCLGEFKKKEMNKFEDTTLGITYNGICCEKCFKQTKN